MEVKDLTQAALNGKIDQFESAFKQVMASKVLDAIARTKMEIGSTVAIDGEEIAEPEGE